MEKKYYLSQSEQGILVECLNPTTKYNLPSLMRLGKDVDPKKLEKCINEFASKHQSIFTIIKKNEDGEIYKIVEPEKISQLSGK